MKIIQLAKSTIMGKSKENIYPKTNDSAVTVESANRTLKDVLIHDVKVNNKSTVVTETGSLKKVSRISTYAHDLPCTFEIGKNEDFEEPINNVQKALNAIGNALYMEDTLTVDVIVTDDSTNLSGKIIGGLDFNGDGQVDIADLNYAINLALNGKPIVLLFKRENHPNTPILRMPLNPNWEYASDSYAEALSGHLAINEDWILTVPSLRGVINNIMFQSPVSYKASSTRFSTVTFIEDEDTHELVPNYEDIYMPGMAYTKCIQDGQLKLESDNSVWHLMAEGVEVDSENGAIFAHADGRTCFITSDPDSCVLTMLTTVPYGDMVKYYPGDFVPNTGTEKTGCVRIVNILLGCDENMESDSTKAKIADDDITSRIIANWVFQGDLVILLGDGRYQMFSTAGTQNVTFQNASDNIRVVARSEYDDHTLALTYL